MVTPFQMAQMLSPHPPAHQNMSLLSMAFNNKKKATSQFAHDVLMYPIALPWHSWVSCRIQADDVTE